MNNYTQLEANQEIHETGLIYDLNSLFAYLLKIQDPRKPKGKRYGLANILVLILLAKMAGEDKPTGIAEWVALRIEKFQEFGLLPGGVAPCHMMYRRVLQHILKPSELEKLLGEYHRRRLQTEEELVFSMDGKTLKGTIPAGETRGVHLLSIFVPSQGLVLAEVTVDRKENEIVAAPHILKQVKLSGVLVIGDAMHTQREVSDQIVTAHGDYLWFVKGNQPRMHWAIQKLFVYEACKLQQGTPLSKEIRVASDVSKGHGRLEKRTIWVSSQLNEYLDWPGVQQVFRLERLTWDSRRKGYKREVVYGLTSLSAKKASAQKLLRLIRKYWGIESGLHYRRDVTMHEDETRLTVADAGHNMAIINNAVLCLCLGLGYKNLAQARRHFNAKPKEALDAILGIRIHPKTLS
jgi:predicted transposase YbfD/YdcC